MAVIRMVRSRGPLGGGKLGGCARDLAGAGGKAGLSGRRLPGIVLTNHPHPVLVSLQDLGRLVGGTVVDADDLDARVLLGQRAFDGHREVLRVVVIVDQDADQRRYLGFRRHDTVTTRRRFHGMFDSPA